MSTNIKVQRICRHCGKEFTARTTVTQYCSNTCSKRDYKARQRKAKIEASNVETQLIKAKPIEVLNEKPFLSISETCKLLGISRRTIYRMLERGQLVPGKAGKRTIIRRSDIDKLFERPIPVINEPESDPEPVEYNISDCYTLEQAMGKYGVSESGLRNQIIRHKIPKFRKGRFAYIPKTIIDKLLS